MENDNQILEALLGVQKNSLRELEAWHALTAQWECTGSDRFQGSGKCTAEHLSPVINYLSFPEPTVPKQLHVMFHYLCLPAKTNNLL